MRKETRSIEDFDAWKTRLTEEALEYRRNDDLTTRENVSIENLLETDLVCEESVEDEYIREEEERQQYAAIIAKASEVLALLTPTQRKRYVLSKAYGMTTREIAEKEGCEQRAVVKSLQQAEKKLKKALDAEK